jgi:hypothetical protein
MDTDAGRGRRAAMKSASMHGEAGSAAAAASKRRIGVLALLGSVRPILDAASEGERRAQGLASQGGVRAAISA